MRLSPTFFLRDFLLSEIAVLHGIPNIPDAPDLAIAAGRQLCRNLLEPLKATFGHIAIRSAYRASAVNAFGNANGLNCACIILPWVADLYAKGADWRALAWWIHDHLPYSRLQFFPKLAAFNINWHECPVRRIDSFISPKGCLTKPGLANHAGDHGEWYQGFPELSFSANGSRGNAGRHDSFD